TPLLNENVSVCGPPVPAAGVPVSVAWPVPPPLFVNVTPVGSVPVCVIVAATGKLWVVIVKLPLLPTVNVVLFALVKRPASLMFSVKVCVPGAPTPLGAVKVRGWGPPVPAAGVPPSVAVPSPLSTKVTPDGAPLWVTAGLGVPRVVTVNAGPAVPTVSVALAALVIDAASS